MRLVKLSNWWCCWWYWSINCHGKIGSHFPNYWSPHNLFTICKFFPTTVGSFSTYLGCSPPVPFVSLFNSLFRNFVGGFAWGTQLTPGDAVKGCTKVECIKRENRINRKVFLFANGLIMSNFCTYLLFTVVLIVVVCSVLFCSSFVVCNIDLDLAALIAFRHNIIIVTQCHLCIGNHMFQHQSFLWNDQCFSQHILIPAYIKKNMFQVGMSDCPVNSVRWR